MRNRYLMNSWEILKNFLSKEEGEKPNFLIPGASRSGTSSLVYYLSEHPEIYFSPIKEIQYFSAFFNQPDEWYVNHFKPGNDEKAVGEASTNYFHHEEVPERIYNFNPDFKLVFILRNPVKRAFSHYKREIQTMGRTKPFLDCLRESDRYLKPGRYHEHLKRYLRFFSRNQIKIVVFDDLVSSTQSTLKSITSFLNVSDTHDFRRINETRNPSEPPTSKWFQQMIFYCFGLRENNLGWIRYFKGGTKVVLNKLNHLIPGDFPEFDDHAKQFLRDYYDEEVKKLSELMDRDLQTKWNLK